MLIENSQMYYIEECFFSKENQKEIREKLMLVSDAFEGSFLQAHRPMTAMAAAPKYRAMKYRNFNRAGNE